MGVNLSECRQKRNKRTLPRVVELTFCISLLSSSGGTPPYLTRKITRSHHRYRVVDHTGHDPADRLFDSLFADSHYGNIGRQGVGKFGGKLSVHSPIPCDDLHRGINRRDTLADELIDFRKHIGSPPVSATGTIGLTVFIMRIAVCTIFGGNDGKKSAEQRHRAGNRRYRVLNVVLYLGYRGAKRGIITVNGSFEPGMRFKEGNRH